mgnify:FL=1
MKVNVYRIRKNAKLPERAHSTDAGMDLFFCPEDGNEATVAPGQSALLQTGIKVSVPEGYMMQVMNKSGVASKKQLVTGACVVDRGYTGEVFINLHNVGKEPRLLEPGMKLAQAVFVKVAMPAVVEIGNDNIYGFETDRGAGALGSTGI